MFGIGVSFILIGYTLIYAGFKDISPITEIAYGLALGPDPFAEKTAAQQAVANPATDKKIDIRDFSPKAWLDR